MRIFSVIEDTCLKTVEVPNNCRPVPTQTRHGFVKDTATRVISKLLRFGTHLHVGHSPHVVDGSDTHGGSILPSPLIFRPVECVSNAV